MHVVINLLLSLVHAGLVHETKPRLERFSSPSALHDIKLVKIYIGSYLASLLARS